MGRATDQSANLGAFGCSGAAHQRHSHVLAQHFPMGAIVGAIWTARRLHFEPAPLFFSRPARSFLAASSLVPKPWRLLLEPRDVDDPVRLSAILLGRKAALDYWPGPPRHGSSR